MVGGGGSPFCQAFKADLFAIASSLPPHPCSYKAPQPAPGLGWFCTRVSHGEGTPCFPPRCPGGILLEPFPGAFCLQRGFWASRGRPLLWHGPPPTHARDVGHRIRVIGKEGEREACLGSLHMPGPGSCELHNNR